MRKIMIATPVAQNQVSVSYAFSLAETAKYAASQGIELFPVFLQGAILEDVRNDLLSLFKHSDAEEVVFIDEDMGWGPGDFYRLLSHKVDFVGAAYRRKTLDGNFVCKSIGGEIPEPKENGLMLVEGVGTGFLRITRKALEVMWKKSQSYFKAGREIKRICEVKVSGKELISEDISMCAKAKEVWLDPKIQLDHVGEMHFSGSFEAWLADLKKHKEVAAAAEKEAKPKRKLKLFQAKDK